MSAHPHDWYDQIHEYEESQTPDMDDMICPGCNVLNPDAGWADFGYGTTEYWGHVSTHHDWHFVTRCCEAEPVPFRPEPDDNLIPESEVA